MEKGILHLHTTVVLIFLISLIIKTTLLLLNKVDVLDKIREKTKVVEMILGTLILATGGYLLFATGNFQGYIIGKIIVVLIAIPLGIIGLKRKVKVLAIISVLLFVYAYGIAETKSLKFKRDKFVLPEEKAITDINTEEGELIHAQKLYQHLCRDCHGDDGRAGVGGAYDLSTSDKSVEENYNIIAKGRGLMPKFKDRLTEEEIKLLAKYVIKFREESSK